MKRLRLRGDWSDTGPNARPDSGSGSSAPENSSNEVAARNENTAVANEQQQTSETENDSSEPDQAAEGLEPGNLATAAPTADADQAGQPRRRGPPVNQNLMQRMTDALSRMLNDPSTRLAMRTLSEREASR